MGNYLSKPISVGFSNDGARTWSGHWKTVESSYEDLLQLLDQAPVGPKDGRAILQGDAVDGVRKARAMRSCSIMMFDLDTGHSIDPVLEKLSESDTYAYIYETYSSGTATSTMLKDQVVKHSGDASLESTIKYLKEKKHYNPDILEGAKLLEEFQDENGIQMKISHQPMPKYRMVFVLKDRFVFAKEAELHQDAIKKWKGLYDAVAKQLGIKYDTSCSDPSRLMYLPTRPDEVTEREIFEVGENCLDLSEFEPTSFGTDRKLSKEITTNCGINLNDWLRAGGRYFQLADVIRECSPDIISRDVEHDKIDVECPWMDDHSGQSRYGFFVSNAAEGNEFAAYCAHNSCSSTGRCRLGYLKGLIDNGSVEASYLSDPDYFAEEDDNPIKWTALNKVCGTVPEVEKTEELTPESSTEDIMSELKKVAALKYSLEKEIALAEIKEKTGVGMVALKQCISEIISEEEDHDNSDQQENPAYAVVPKVPKNLKKYKGPIYIDWGYSTVLEVCQKQMEAELNKDPYIFKTTEGSVIRIVDRDVVVPEPLRADSWQHEITKFCTFNKVKKDETLSEAVPKAVVSDFNGSSSLDIPELDRIVQVPIFSEDGTLCYRERYNPISRCYLKSDDEFFSPAKRPTERDICRAKYLIENWALASFPFSDHFSGEEILPIFTAKSDNEEYPAKHKNRGHSSLAHVYCMLIQNLVRSMIHGPCPMYFIDKSAPGTGAGYLASVPSAVITGRSPKTQVISRNEEEFCKTITANVAGRTEMIFLDNVNHEVDSPSLASALTSGVWSGRELGKSNMMEYPIKSLWIIAGNNVSFTSELMRRNIPIRLDASTPNPAIDRKLDSYKVRNFQYWLLENRVELICACHTLVNNWIQQGMPEYSGEPLQSFTDWSMVLGGILESNDIEGFLENIPNYLDSDDDETQQDVAFVQAVFDQFGTSQKFTAKQVFDSFFDVMAGSFQFELSNGMILREAGGSIQLGRFIGSKLQGATFQLYDKSDSGYYKLIKHKAYSPSQYKFIKVSEE